MPVGGGLAWSRLKLAALGAAAVLLLAVSSAWIPRAAGQLPTPTPVPPTGPTGPTVRLTYPPGWNLAAAPSGAALPQSPRTIYTFQPGDTTYQTANPSSTQPGYGYWVYFDSLTAAVFPGAGPETFTRTIPAAQWLMVGNPRGTIVVVTGVDVLYIYDPVQGYQQTTVLQPGQGGWAFSNAGGTVTFTDAAP